MPQMVSFFFFFVNNLLDKFQFAKMCYRHKRTCFASSIELVYETFCGPDNPLLHVLPQQKYSLTGVMLWTWRVCWRRRRSWSETLSVPTVRRNSCHASWWPTETKVARSAFIFSSFSLLLALALFGSKHNKCCFLMQFSIERFWMRWVS